MDGFARLYSLAALAFSSYPVTDFLGRVCIELDMHHKHAGQYFTPAPVARAMAQIALHDCASLIARQGFLTVMEPACGSGCMLIEAANVLHERGYNPAQVLRAQAADISRDCFNMAYAQLSWLNLQGVVMHRNSLGEDTWEHRATPMEMVMTPLGP